MVPRALLPISLLILNVSAFNIITYSSKQCTGLPAKIQLNVADGCNTFRAGEAQAFIMKWESLVDNNLVLVTYRDKHCCHADMIETYGWEDECTPFGVEGVASWRVIDPNDADKGKDSEVDDYACRTCGKDECGTVAPGLIPSVP